MRFYRLVKPIWGEPKLQNGEPNPKFKKEVNGPPTFEGCNFSNEFLKEKNDLGYNIYFFPNHPTKDVYKTGLKYLSGKYIDKFNFVFVDMDLKDNIYKDKQEFYDRLAQFKLKPSMVVDSGNGVHAYWRVSDLTRNHYCLLQMALLNHFMTDESVWTVLQLMRLPGFNNTKRFKDYVPAQMKAELCDPRATYKIKDFDKQLVKDLSQDQIHKVQRHLDRLDGKDSLNFGKDKNFDELPEKFLELIEVNDKIRAMYEDPKSVGDRSAVDMKLTNILFSKKYDINEALAVISNSEKALEKGHNRMEYAKTTVEKVYSDRPKNKFQTASDYLRESRDAILEKPVKGPYYMDTGVLEEPWRRNEMLGIIAGSGVGKTSIALNVVKSTIENNPENDDVFIFFSLEMTKGQIIRRWLKLVGEDSPLTNRLYVVDRQGDDALPKDMGLQELYAYCTELKQVTGKEIGAVIIDHFHIIDKHIDITKQPNFGIKSQNTKGGVQALTDNDLASQLKTLTVSLKTFMILLTQTTKDKGAGDTPLGKDACYGVSQFEWIVDRIITAWQPLMRVQDLTESRYLAFQYAKIREKRPGDKIKELVPKLLTFNLDTGGLRVTNQEEYQEFTTLLPRAVEARQLMAKKEADSYSIQLDINELDSIVKKMGGSR